MGSPDGGGGGGGGRGGVGDGSNDRKVFVGGLPQNVDEAAVRGLFHEKGQVERVTLSHAQFTTSFIPALLLALLALTCVSPGGACDATARPRNKHL